MTEIQLPEHVISCIHSIGRFRLDEGNVEIKDMIPLIYRWLFLGLSRLPANDRNNFINATFTDHDTIVHYGEAFNLLIG
jgi:hypothetical protein